MLINEDLIDDYSSEKISTYSKISSIFYLIAIIAGLCLFADAFFIKTEYWSEDTISELYFLVGSTVLGGSLFGMIFFVIAIRKKEKLLLLNKAGFIISILFSSLLLFALLR